MTDSTNTMNLRGFLPWRVITHKEMKLCRSTLAAPSWQASPPLPHLPRQRSPVAGPDPIFAVIEAHRRASQDFDRCQAVELDLDERLPSDRKSSHPAVLMKGLGLTRRTRGNGAMLWWRHGAPPERNTNPCASCWRRGPSRWPASWRYSITCTPLPHLPAGPFDRNIERDLIEPPHRPRTNCRRKFLRQSRRGGALDRGRVMSGACDNRRGQSFRQETVAAR
jgi:hypothetical protein